MLIKMLATSGSCKRSWARRCNFTMLRRSTSLSFPETSMDESILLVLNVRRLHTIREKVTFAGCPCIKPAVALFVLWLTAKLWKHCSRQELPSSLKPSLRSCLNQRLNRELQRYKDIPRKMSDQHLTETSHSRLTMYYSSIVSSIGAAEWFKIPVDSVWKRGYLYRYVSVHEQYYRKGKKSCVVVMKQ